MVKIKADEIEVMFGTAQLRMYIVFKKEVYLFESVHKFIRIGLSFIYCY
jgi:glutaredoxin-related protein